MRVRPEELRARGLSAAEIPGDAAGEMRYTFCLRNMDDALATGLRFEDRYELTERLGEGAYGEVWAASDTRFPGRRVAVKFLKPPFDRQDDAARRFEREADALGMLQHPNVVAVIDRGRLGTRPFIVMEYVDGTPLDEWLQQHRDDKSRTELGTVREIFDQVCRGVAAAHAVRTPGAIVHRDLKPANVMIVERSGGERIVKVLDFGIAQLGSGAGTLPGVVYGTPDYMAPEQASGQGSRIGPATDVFALGVILTEMLTLRWYAADEEQWHYAASTRHGKVEPLLVGLRPGVPGEVWRVIAKALQPDPRVRFPDAGALREALLLAWGRGGAGFSRWAKTLGALALAALVVGGGGAALQRRGATVAPRQPAVSVDGGGRAPVPPERRAVEAPPEAERVCPEGALRVGPGSFEMGSGPGEGEDDERPAHRVTLGAYCIDRTEVTVAQYDRCVAEGRCPPAPRTVDWPGVTASDRAFGARFCNDARQGRGAHPMNCVTWAEADRFCTSKGGRLPTEAEWEFSARGQDGLRYPWGAAAPRSTLLNACGVECARLGTSLGQTWQTMFPEDDGWDTTAPVGSYPAGASPVGAVDLAGNVGEWTADRYGPYAEGAVTDPRGPSTGDRRVTRGGGWNFGDPAWVRAADRDPVPETFRDRYLGFRCGYDLRARSGGDGGVARETERGR